MNEGFQEAYGTYITLGGLALLLIGSLGAAFIAYQSYEHVLQTLA
ncbi:hypothetical protein [Bacillus manliponensis]|nr:hypothetical protein [Bacillus manliponensis]